MYFSLTCTHKCTHTSLSLRHHFLIVFCHILKYIRIYTQTSILFLTSKMNVTVLSQSILHQYFSPSFILQLQPSFILAIKLRSHLSPYLPVLPAFISYLLLSESFQKSFFLVILSLVQYATVLLPKSLPLTFVLYNSHILS